MHTLHVHPVAGHAMGLASCEHAQHILTLNRCGQSKSSICGPCELLKSEGVAFDISNTLTILVAHHDACILRFVNFYEDNTTIAEG